MSETTPSSPTPQPAPSEGAPPLETAQPAGPAESASRPPEISAQLRSKTREELAALAGEVENPLLVAATRERAIQDFRNKVIEKGFDFAGAHNGDSDFEQNPVYQNIREKLKTFFESCDSSIPVAIQVRWMEHALNFVTGKIASYSGATGLLAGKMDSADAENMFNDLKNLGKSGVGELEAWFKKYYGAEHSKWETETGRQTQQRQSLASAKEDAKKSLDGAVGALPQQVKDFPGLKTATAKFKENIAKTITQENLDEIKNAAANFPSRVKAVFEKTQELKTAVSSLPQTEAAQALANRLNTLENNIKAAAEEEPLKTCETDLQTLETEVKTAQDAAKTVSEEPDEDESEPAADSLLSWANKLSDGKLKQSLMRIAVLLVSIAVSVSKIPYIGDKIRSSLVSDTLLAEKGDEKTKAQAKLRLATKAEFKKFGLPRTLAEELGGKKTPDAIKALKDAVSKTTDEAYKSKLQQLLSQLAKKNGQTSEKTLCEFMTAPEWTGIQYGTAIAADPSGTPASGPAPTATPSAAPAALAGQAPGAPSAPSTSTAPPAAAA